jgi:phosphotransferase system HPr (HPr) family protein
VSIFGRPKKAPPIEKEFETKWRIGARTAAIIVRLTSQFRSEISLSDGENTVNAKSIMGILMLGEMMLQSEADSKNTSYAALRDAGLKAGSRIRVTARGPDAAAAMGALSELLSCGARFDLCTEPGCPSPPMHNSAHNISHEEIVALQEKFREIKLIINNLLAVMMALSEMSQRRPEFSEKLARTVLTKAPLIVSSLQEFTQALNEKAGPKRDISGSC